MHMREVYRVFDIVLEDNDGHANVSEAIIAANDHIKDIDGARIDEWSPTVIRLRFEEHVSAHNVMLDIMDKLSALGYK